MTTYLSKAVSRSIATSSTDKTILTSGSATATATSTLSSLDAKQNAITKAATLSAQNAIAAISPASANNANTNVATRTVSSTTTTGVAGAIPWITNDTTTLKNVDGKYYQMRGFSLTSLEYAGSLFGPNGYYDFGYFTQDLSGNKYTQYMNATLNYLDPPANGNSSITLNAYYLMQNVMKQLAKVGDGSLDSPYSVPMIRIPVNADYWLKGTANSPSLNLYAAPYYEAGQSNVSFTATQYQQAILELILYFSTTWKTIGYGIDMTFVIDLNWNYVA